MVTVLPLSVSTSLNVGTFKTLVVTDVISDVVCFPVVLVTLTWML